MNLPVLTTSYKWNNAERKKKEVLNEQSDFKITFETAVWF
jgi:hypothetical protein